MLDNSSFFFSNRALPFIRQPFLLFFSFMCFLNGRACRPCPRIVFDHGVLHPPFSQPGLAYRLEPNNRSVPLSRAFFLFPFVDWFFKFVGRRRGRGPPPPLIPQASPSDGICSAQPPSPFTGVVMSYLAHPSKITFSWNVRRLNFFQLRRLPFFHSCRPLLLRLLSNPLSC